MRSWIPRGRYFGDILLFSLIIGMAAFLFFSFFPGTPSWIRKGLVEKLGLTLIIFMVFFLFSITIQFENRRISSWELALVGVMGSFSAASRIPFVVVPSVQPCTVIILAVGLVFGWRMGFMVGAITGLASNFFLPMGPWAIWQIFAWGVGGMVAGLAGRIYPKAGMVTLLVLAVFWGVIYGIILDLYTLGIFLSAGDSLSLSVIGKTYLPALPFNLLHVGGNIIFALLLGPSLLWVLRRFRKRYGWEGGLSNIINK